MLWGSLAATALDCFQLWPVPTFPPLNVAERTTAAAASASILAVFSSWPLLLRVASTVFRVLGISLGVKVAGDAHREQQADWWPVLLATSAAQLALIVLPAVQEGATTPPRVETHGEQAVANPISEFSAVVVGAGIVGYFLSRRWSEEALTLISAADGTEVEARTGVLAEGQTNAVHTHLPSSSASSASPSPPRLRRSRGLCVRVLRCLLFLWLVCALSLSWVLQVSPSEEGSAAAGVPLKVSLVRLYRSPDVQLLFTKLDVLWQQVKREGWEACWARIKEANNLGVVDSSLDTLGFTADKGKTISMAQLRKRRNQLALVYHPDKSHPDSAGLTKLEKENKFNHIQKAYEVLQKHVEQRDAEPKKPAAPPPTQTPGRRPKQPTPSAPPKPDSRTPSSKRAPGQPQTQSRTNQRARSTN